MPKVKPLDVETAMHYAHCREDRCILGCGCMCHSGLKFPPLPLRGLAAATAAQILGLISLIIWPLGGAAMLLGLVGIHRGRGRSQLVASRALTGIVTGALSGTVFAAAVVLIALHHGS